MTSLFGASVKYPKGSFKALFKIFGHYKNLKLISKEFRNNSYVIVDDIEI